MNFIIPLDDHKKSKEFNEELQLTNEGYNFLNITESKKEVIKSGLRLISKEKKDYNYKESFDNLFPIVKLEGLSYDSSEYYDDEEKQIEFLQSLQYYISRKIVNEYLEPIKEKNTNKNLLVDINIVNRGYKILNDEGKIKLIEWCIDELEKNYKIKLTMEQFVDVFVEDVDFGLLANIYSKDEEKQIEFLQNIACIMQELISLNLVDENYNQKQHVKK